MDTAKKWVSDIPKPVDLYYKDAQTAALIANMHIYSKPFHKENHKPPMYKEEADKIFYSKPIYKENELAFSLIVRGDLQEKIFDFFKENKIVFDLEQSEFAGGHPAPYFDMSIKDSDSIRKLAVAGFEFPGSKELLEQEFRLRTNAILKQQGIH